MNRRRSDKINRRESLAKRQASEVMRRKNTHLIIDGYNLMHVTRFKPMSEAEGELRRCRDGLLAMLAKHLAPGRYQSIKVVFDSNNAPKHLPAQSRWQHLEVVFARNENSADDLIAQLIRQHPSPKRLVVVSSDHRIHVAGGKRVAVVDSDTWVEFLLATDSNDRAANDSRDEVVDDSPSQGLDPLTTQELAEFTTAMSDPVEIVPDEKLDEAATEFENPFPEGFFDDLDQEDI